MSKPIEIPSMEPPLQTILEAELAKGNEMKEVSSWPPKCKLLVILKYRFAGFYEVSEEVEFRTLNDPYYWYSEYNLRGGIQTLACYPLRNPHLS